MNTPVTLIIFNRPATTRRVFERIRQARPARLFVISDGPRPSVPTDAALVAEARAIVEKGVDWPCEVRTNFSETNLGCRERVVSGLNWVFEQAEEAIILEDDCLPGESFFPYCEALLERYRDTPEVMHIGANNFQGWRRRTRASFFFSKYNHVWGWATWRRAWRLFDVDAKLWDNPETRARIEALFDTPEERQYWSTRFDTLKTPVTRRNVWDYYWTLTCWAHGGLATYPERNLIENIGFGADATHTNWGDTSRQIPARSLGRLIFPQEIVRNTAADRFTFATVFNLQAVFPRNMINALRIYGGWLKKIIRLRQGAQSPK